MTRTKYLKENEELLITNILNKPFILKGRIKNKDGLTKKKV